MNNNNNNANFTLIVGPSALFTEAEEFDASFQDLASSGDVPDGDVPDGGVFKELYPQVERDKNTGERSRVISETSAFPAIQQRDGHFNLDMLAIEAGVSNENGEREGAHLFTTKRKKAGKERIEQVVVDAHGAFKVSARDEITLQPETPAVVFLGPHGKILETALKDIYSSYAKVSFEGITLLSEQAMNDFNAFGYERITGTSTMGAIRNYELGKHKEKEKELDPQHGKHYFEFVISYMHLCREREERQRRIGTLPHKVQQAFDVIALRKKGPNLSTRDVIRIAQEQGYSQIIFSFCRSPLQAQSLRNILSSFFRIGGNSKSDVYKASSTKQLEEPVFYSWDKINRLEIEKGRVSENQEAPSCSTPRMSG